MSLLRTTYIDTLCSLKSTLGNDSQFVQITDAIDFAVRDMEMVDALGLDHDHELGRIKVGDIVQHFKRETLSMPMNLYLYKVIAIATHTESKEKVVVYQALYENVSMGVHFDTYVRPFDMFMGKVDKKKYPSIKQEYRFEVYKGDNDKIVTERTMTDGK